MKTKRVCSYHGPACMSRACLGPPDELPMNTIIYTASCGHSSEYRGTVRIQVSDVFRCPLCHQVVTVVALSAPLAGQRQGRMKSSPDDMSACCGRYPVSHPGAVCADGAGCKKPHLRLHYKATDGGRPTKFNWEVEYVRGPSKRVRRRSYWHDTSWGALMGAVTLWFPEWR